MLYYSTLLPICQQKLQVGKKIIIIQIVNENTQCRDILFSVSNQKANGKTVGLTFDKRLIFIVALSTNS